MVLFFNWNKISDDLVLPLFTSKSMRGASFKTLSANFRTDLSDFRSSWNALAVPVEMPDDLSDAINSSPLISDRQP